MRKALYTIGIAAIIVLLYMSIASAAFYAESQIEIQQKNGVEYLIVRQVIELQPKDAWSIWFVIESAREFPIFANPTMFGGQIAVERRLDKSSLILGRQKSFTGEAITYLQIARPW